MFEFEELSTGFHEILLNKYAESPGPILDLFISDSMQEMLDIDIRSEVATVATGTSEFSSLINDLPASLELDITSNDGEISWLGGPWWSTSTTTDIYADVGACVNPNSVMPMPLITTSLINSSKAHQVNLNTTTSSTNNSHINNNSPPQSPKENKSHLTFSPHQIKVPPVQDNHKNKGLSPLVSSTTLRPSITSAVAASSTGNLRNRNLAEIVKKDLSNDLMQEENASARKVSSSNITQNSVLSTNILSGSNTIKLAPGIGGLTFSNSLSYNKLKQSNNVKSLNAGGNIIIKSEKESSSSSNSNHQQHNNIMNWIPSNGNIQNSNKTLSRSILVQNNKNFSSINGSNSPNPHHHNHHQQQQQQQQSHHQQNNLHTKPKLSSKPIDYEYPKPAYSYSCLIAMALKNSRSGSLPVSEIYSFMCEHFPYFKTAPNGWKNSVRHNLSLNKCFEKIEKPATNGSQRKGCLWAMNPAKITKMDEEVQKWSRKDPLAIRKAMVFPEHLEALERGEMKHGSTGDSDNENEAQSDTEENFEDSEQEHEQDSDENLIKTPESLVNEDEEGDDAPANGDKEYEVEMTDFYDSIDLEDDKESVRRIIHQQNDLLASVKGGRTSEDYSTSKRARLDVNYSIGPAGVFDQQQRIHHHQQHHQQQQTQPQLQQPTAHHNRRKMQLVNRIA